MHTDLTTEPTHLAQPPTPDPQSPTPRKVLVIGSGPIIIGQAAEFDYAGSQACRALREEGIVSVLVNSNPATIMTDQDVADVVYIEPLTVEAVTRIIARERPDALLPTLGGQTGLNLAVALAEAGVLDEYGVRLLASPLPTIKNAEDRELFKQLLISIGEPVPESRTCYTVEEAREFVAQIGLPVVIRPAFTLGGTGGGIASTEEEFERITVGGLRASPVTQVLVERCLIGWKELEYEVMRDANDTCITICNMENIDPMGVHTGDSIVVAPSQTLSDREYQGLRQSALKIIRALKIEGGCNVQFALDPASSEYFVIEVNPRVSRSSALASKATGYPIARVATKIAVGKRLDEIPNAVTGKTTAAFEPALDYVVVKIPRWPFDKFPSGDRTLGTQMKATGEVMAVDRSFPGALQKAVRSLEVGGRTLLWEHPTWTDAQGNPTEGLMKALSVPNDQRIWALAAALRHGLSAEAIHAATHVDRWFLDGINRIIALERRLLGEPLTPDLMKQAKRLGFSDAQIGTLSDRLPEQVRELRLRWGIRPTYKMVDTCAAEFEAQTPYFYSTWEQENEAPPLPDPKAIVIGSGPIRIGQGIEFDYCSVHAAWSLQAEGRRAIMVNSNPETVSTDFDTSNRLYFEPLDEESVRNIIENEEGELAQGEPHPQPLPSVGRGVRTGATVEDSPPHAGEGLGVRSVSAPAITQFGGQTAINLAGPLERACATLLGSGVEAIDLAEDRRRFERLLNELGIPQPPGGAVTRLEDALNVAKNIGYPVLVRPSYVLGGRAMEIVQNASELTTYIAAAVEISERRPILVDKYLQGKEAEVDAICDGEQVLIPGLMEHIERAGVHSGDSIAVYPGVNLSESEVETMVDYTTRIGNALGVRGLMNVQFILFEGGVYVLKVNPRASRTVPFLSKVTGVPMTRLATAIALGQSLKEQGYSGGLWPRQKLVAVKAPVFSMAKLIGVDSYLGPEMKSTGEVMGIDYTLPAAMAKAAISAGMALQPPSRGGMLLSLADDDKPAAVPLIRKLIGAGYALYATEGTAAMIKALELPVQMVTKKLDQGHPNVVDVIRGGQVRSVLNTVTGDRAPLRDGFEIRRAAAETGVTLFSSLDTADAVVHAMLDASGEEGYHILPMHEYTGRGQPHLPAPSPERGGGARAAVPG